MNPIAIETIHADLINAVPCPSDDHAEAPAVTALTSGRPFARTAQRGARLHMWRKYMLLRAIDDVRSDYVHRQANHYARHHRAPLDVETER